MNRLLMVLALAAILASCRKSAPEAARMELERQHVDISAGAGVGAARAGDLEKINLLRDAGLDFSLADGTGEVPLRAALAAGHAGVVDALVRGGATSLDSANAAPREISAQSVKILESAAKAVLQDPGAQSALSWALARRDLSTLKLLLDHGADPNQTMQTPAGEDFIKVVGDDHFSYYLRREKKVTPLMLAASTGQLEASELLLKAGADPDATTARHKTEAIWLAGKGHHVAIVQLLLGKDPRPESQSIKVQVSLGRQKAIIYRDGAPVDSSPISSGRKGFGTPKGAYVVTNKYREWKSTLYEDASMPFFMRLSCGDFGLHAGVLPGYPASHGCIRMPYEKARAFFSKVEVGTLVEIVD